MVGPIQDVIEAQFARNAHRGLVPAGIETHQAGIAREFECADGASRRQKSQHRDDALAQARQLGMNRK